VQELTEPESKLVEILLYMTGKEDRLSRAPIVQREQVAGIRAIWPILKSAGDKAMDPTARADLLNRLLLTLGIVPMSFDFFETVFRSLDFSDFDEFQKRVDLFRTLCMLEYGSFRFGYKQLRRGKLIREKWRKHFPDESEVTERARELRSRLEPIGLVTIPPSQLFSLGYLASEHAPEINGARKQLIAVISRALVDKVNDFRSLQEAAKTVGVSGLTNLLAKAGIPGTESVIYPDMPLFGGKKPYSEVLLSLQESCVSVDEDAIRKAREDGLQNARTYMAAQKLDVYVATSMREPLHFTTNWAFVQSLFHRGNLAEWNMRYFDPTQAFLEDRIQKGLLECLMIKRSRLTVYNAQEADTFGKDAEAGVTLAQGKPVIVYVARLFDHLESLKPLYSVIDEAARIDRDAFIQKAEEKGFLDTSQKSALLAPDKTKSDAVAATINYHAPPELAKLAPDRILLELIRQGYDPDRIGGDALKFAVERILNLERRALIFRDVHPLSLQTSPMDGVARGVIVTRTVADTGAVIRGIFLGKMEYQIIDDHDNWLLVDRITGSPVRVVTKDPILTTAFWSENWADTQTGD
jgi:hypothetical protein